MSFITLVEYADKCGLSRQRIFQLIKDGRLKSAKKEGDRWFVDENDVVDKPLTSEPKKPRQKAMLEKESSLNGLVTIDRYAELHGITVSGIRRRIRDNRMKSAVKSGRKWFLDPNEPLYDGRRKEREEYARLPVSNEGRNLVTCAKYAQIHGVRPDTVRRKINHGEMKSAVEIASTYYLDVNEPWIDKRVKNGKYVGAENGLDLDFDCDTGKFGTNALSGVIVSLLSETTYLKTKRSEKEEYYKEKWGMNQSEMETLEDHLYIALHPDTE